MFSLVKGTLTGMSIIRDHEGVLPVYSVYNTSGTLLAIGTDVGRLVNNLNSRIMCQHNAWAVGHRSCLLQKKEILLMWQANYSLRWDMWKIIHG